MPEMRFVVRWPDEKVSSCYSPSQVVRDYLTEGESYAIEDFVERCRTSLTIASERVKQKYGFYCTAASSQLAEIEAIARTFEGVGGGEAGRVTVLRLE